MIVVHGLVTTAGRPALWAESAPPACRCAPDPGPVDGDPPAHPFATTPPIEGQTDRVTVLLPSAGSRPVPSPDWGTDHECSDHDCPGPVRMSTWTVPVVPLEPGIDPEAMIDQEQGDRELIRCAGSVGQLADVVAFAADLTRRGRVIPTIVDGPRARWQAVLHGPDLARFAELQAALPPSALAAGAWSADRALRAVLDSEVDGLIRARLSEPLIPEPATRPTATRSWLNALTGSQPAFDGDPDEVRRLREVLDTWQDGGAPASMRTCFRLTYLEEGEADDEPDGWLLEFLVQSVADPSVLIPADRVWAGRDSALLTWAGATEDPQFVLLGDLGRASRLYPDLDDVLRQSRPSQMFLDVAGAYRFLTHAPMLEEAGFGVLLPARWQQRTELGLALTVQSRQTTTAVLRDQTADLNSIVDFHWGLALGSEFLSETDLRKLARAKLPLVRLRGRWVYLDTERLAAGIAFLARGGSGQMTAGEVLRQVRLFPEREQPLPVTAIEGSGWLADLLTGRMDEKLALLDPPESLRATLRPYQRKGLSWLAFLDRLGVGALLADDMGLGKTVQVLALEALSRERGPRPPTLIVCPLSVLGNWQREIERFTPTLRVAVHHGGQRDLTGDHDLVLTTYNLVSRDIETLGARTWDRVVLDEAQYVKNSASATAQAVRRIPARHRVALTGTPVENRLTELWSIMDFLNPGVLGPASTFRARYSVPVERYADDEAAGRLRRVTRPFLLRRLKTDTDVINDLPEKIERTQWCNLTTEQTSLYRAVVDELSIRLRESRFGSQRKGLVLSAMTKLKQVCNHPAQLLGDNSPVPGRSGKVERLEEILANVLADDGRALVFTQYARLGAMLRPHLSARLGTEVAFLYGGTAKGARDAMVERFNNTGDGPRVLLLSLKAGGTGLNLTAANHVIHLDRWWNPATEAQATDRAFRIGQRRDVQVHKFVCIGTIEERIDRMITEKSSLAQLAVGSGEGWLTGLSTNDLLDLVSLAPSEAADG